MQNKTNIIEINNLIKIENKINELIIISKEIYINAKNETLYEISLLIYELLNRKKRIKTIIDKNRQIKVSIKNISELLEIL